MPLYWLVTLFLTSFPRSWHPKLFPLDHPARLTCAGVTVIHPHLAPDGKSYPMVLQGWTLNYEMFFYVLFAVTLAWFRTCQFYALNALLLGCVLCGYLTHATSPAGVTYTSPLLMEFLAGIHICRAWQNNTLLSTTTSWTAIAIGVAGISVHDYFNFSLPRVLGSGVPARSSYWVRFRLRVDTPFQECVC